MNFVSILLFAVPCVVAFGGAGCKPVVPASYPVTEKEHIYYDGETKLHGYLMTPEVPGAETLPGLLVLPYFMGAPALPDRETGRKYAKRGMVVFVADYYGKQYDDADAAHIQEALTTTYPAMVGDWEAGHRIAKLGLKQLTSQSNVNADKIGVMGFCAGGTMTSFLARSGAKITVAIDFHGDATDLEGEAIEAHNTKYFAGFFGRNDPMIPPAAVETGTQWLSKATTDGNSDYEVNVYGNTVHGFTVPMSDTVMTFLESIGFGGAAKYNPTASKAAFDRAEALFVEHGLLSN